MCVYNVAIRIGRVTDNVSNYANKKLQDKMRYSPYNLSFCI